MVEWIRSVSIDQWIGFGLLIAAAAGVGLLKRKLDEDEQKE